MISIEINGQKVAATPGKMLIEVTDRLGITVPRFCYHNKLPIAANCRMCLVEVEKVPKPLPACATPVTDGMKIWTKSKLSVEAQKSALEFLLINHPLDCPICDQGGECELQDLSMGYGSGFSNFKEAKRVVVDKNLGPLIKTDLTRCIHCTRCVRFGQDIAGFRELGATGRGEHLEIGTFIEKNVESEVSGNVIDLCPVGALTSKPFAYKARSWELTQISSIAPHDCVGSNIYIHTRRNQVMRVVPRENTAINEIWLADRDRFSYEAIYSQERLTQPKIKTKAGWQDTSWEVALQFVVNKLQQVKEQQSGAQIGALVSPSASCEEMYLLQKIMRGLGSHNIDHRLKQLDFSDAAYYPFFPNLGGSFVELKQAEHILLIGSNIHKEQPIVGLHLRKNSLNGGKVSIINPLDFVLNFTVQHKIIPNAGDLITPLAGIAKYILHAANIQSEQTIKFKALLANYTPSKEQELIAQAMLATQNGHIVLGALAINHPQAAKINSLCNFIAQLTGHKFGLLTEGGNTAGAWLTGCVPHSLGSGENAQQMLSENLAAYILFGIEPQLDSCMGEHAVTCLNKAELVVAFTAFACPSLLASANIMLPIATWLETPGTYINCTGDWQSIFAAVTPVAQVRPGWKVLCDLANLLELENFAYASSQEILIAIKNTVKLADSLPKFKQYIPDNLGNNINGLFRVASTPIYAIDMFVRRAKALAATKDAISADVALLSQQQLDKLGFGVTKVAVKTRQGRLTCQVKASMLVPEQTIWLNQSLDSTSGISSLAAEIEVRAL